MDKRTKPLSEAEKREIRRLFPFLVALAKKKIPPMPYSRITEYTGIHWRKWLGRALGNIRDPKTLYLLLDSRSRPKEIPRYPDINTMAVNLDGAPGAEWARELDVGRAYKELKTLKERIEFTRSYQMGVYEFKDWDKIIGELGLSDVLFAYERLLENTMPDCENCVFGIWNEFWVESCQASQDEKSKRLW